MELIEVNETNNICNVIVKIPVFNTVEIIELHVIRCLEINGFKTTCYNLQNHLCNFDDFVYQDLLLEKTGNRCHMFGFIDLFNIDKIILPFSAKKLINTYLAINDDKLSFYYLKNDYYHNLKSNTMEKLEPYDFLYMYGFIPEIEPNSSLSNEDLFEFGRKLFNNKEWYERFWNIANNYSSFSLSKNLKPAKESIVNINKLYDDLVNFTGKRINNIKFVKRKGSSHLFYRFNYIDITFYL